MFKYNNTHIFTGYLKQLLSTVNIPTCKIYTSEFARYAAKHGKEDPRVIESFDTQSKNCLATRINYLKGNELYKYFLPAENIANAARESAYWDKVSTIQYIPDKATHGLTRVLNSPGIIYDQTTHEYLGEYLRFLRDYYNVNLMSMYNCFNDRICNNIYYNNSDRSVVFDFRDPQYKIYAIPVKLFYNYTIAIDCSLGIELFCGLYNGQLDTSAKALTIADKTYKKVNKVLFNQPFLYDKLDIKNWLFESEIDGLASNNKITRWDIAKREQDLKLFIKIPSTCKSSVVILEGDYRAFNNCRYTPPGQYHHDGTLVSDKADNTELSTRQSVWKFERNSSIVNFDDKEDLNMGGFVPISRLQLLAFNTGTSYPFADRLIEYLAGSAITSVDDIHDNIKRVQRVMNQNNHYFKIEGLWENKIQKIIYDYLMNAGPIEYVNGDNKLIDKRIGYHKQIGHTSKSMLYDILGYVDKDAEKWYVSWLFERGKPVIKNGKPVISDSIQSIDIYDGLYDI